MSPRQLLLMIDEFPALGRLEFFESSLAFLAGYGVRAVLVAQSLHQIDKAYGPHHAILDNCHVRVAFTPNDERTAKRLSETLGTATELRALKNFSGRRFAAWLSHTSVAEQETPRALLTVGEILQLSADEALILVSGVPPIRARKLRYYLDGNFLRRRMLPPALGSDAYADAPPPRPHDWCSPALTPDPRLQEMSASPAVENHPHDDAQTPRPRQRERNKARVSDLPLFADLADSAIADDNPQSADRADDERVTKFPGLRL
jgi:type IV secretion system protein VirD4